MHWSFGTFLWSTFVIFMWFAVLWMFVAVCADVLRRDMSGWGKAGWIILIVFLPFVGILIYLIAKPRTVGWGGTTSPSYAVTHYGDAERQATDEIRKASLLRDEGIINSAEYEHLKQQALHH